MRLKSPGFSGEFISMRSTSVPTDGGLFRMPFNLEMEYQLFGDVECPAYWTESEVAKQIVDISEEHI